MDKKKFKFLRPHFLVYLDVCMFLSLCSHFLPGKGAAPAPKKKELAVEENTEILCSRLCGGNIYKEGEDPVLKDDSEYPEWLWTLKTDWTPIPLEAYSEDDPRYWQKLKKMNIKRNIALKKHKKRQ